MVSTTVTVPVPSWMPPSGVLVSVSGAPVPRTVSTRPLCAVMRVVPVTEAALSALAV
ncbi:hypothetical protein ABT150_49935 [Streptomyces mirabilis]|uniref:hypothetical protein n=1 Tax=Streptomyces mirabilis TaxID=68239 RepID=UPI003325C9DF